MILKSKMLIVAVVAGFCGFLLRSATTPSAETPSQPTLVLSAVAKDARSPMDMAAAFDGLGQRVEGLVASLREKAFRPEAAPGSEAALIAIPDALDAVPTVALVSLPASLPSLDQAAPLEKVVAPSLPTLEPAVPPTSLPRVARAAVPARRAPAAVNPQANPRKYRELGATVTAYCPCSRCCGARARGRTSLGGSAWLPGIAADPRALPYGTVVDVPGYGVHTVDDTGGAMRDSWRNHGRLHLDIRMKTHYEARQWGRRTMKVRVYGK